MPSPRPFTAEEYVTLQLPDSPAATPDGGACAFVVAESDMEESRVVTHLWLADAEGEDFRQITFSHDGEESPSFSPDGLWLAFLSSRPDSTRPEPELEEDEEPRPQLWVLPSMGGEARCLTDAREGVRDYDWLPDGSGLIYLTEEARPKALQAHRMNKQNFKEDAVIEDGERRRIGVWRVEVEEDGENERVWAGDLGGLGIHASPDGTKAVYVTNATGDPNDYALTDLWLVDLDAGEARPLTRRSGPEWDPQWSPEGDRVAFLAGQDPEVSYSQTRLWSVSVESGEIRPLLEADMEIVAYVWPRKCPDSLFFTAAQGLYCQLYWLRLSTGVVEAITAPEGVCGGFDLSEEGDTAYLIWEDGTRLPDLYRLDLVGGSPSPRPSTTPLPLGEGPGVQPDPSDPTVQQDSTEPSPPQGEGGAERRVRGEAPAEEDEEATLRITDLNPEWREVELGPQRVFSWQSDGLPIEGLLVLPARPPEGRRLPLIVYVHGGPHAAMRNNLRQGIPLQWLAQQGYAILAPNYRGSSGGGAAFSVANRRDLGGGDFRDVMAGVDAAIEAGIADPDRLAIMGGSYGGYMTNWAISQTGRFRAAVSLFGIFNWVTDFGNSDVSHFEKEYFGQYYWEDPTLYFERSPFRYVDRIHTPVLILHGEDDPNTFISNSQEMYRALKALGRTVQFVRYPREGHGFHEPRHRIDLLHRVSAWLDSYLMGEGPEKPAVYRMDQDVPGAGGWTLRVTSADAVKPVGVTVTEDSLIVNPVFVFASERKDAGYALNLSEVKAEANGEPCPFLGVPVKTLDEVILTTGEGLRVEFQGGEPPSAFPVAAVFRAPKGAAEMTLRVPGFPAVILPLPKPEGEDEKDSPGDGEPPHKHGPEDGENHRPHPGPVQKVSG